MTQATALQRTLVSIGPGIGWRDSIGGGELTLRAEVAAGRLQLDESHPLRKDLGPMPNIRYGLWTATGTIGAEFQHHLTEGLSLSVGATIRETYGHGEVVFAPGSALQFAPLPAEVARVAASVNASLLGQF